MKRAQSLFVVGVMVMLVVSACGAPAAPAMESASTAAATGDAVTAPAANDGVMAGDVMTDTLTDETMAGDHPAMAGDAMTDTIMAGGAIADDAMMADGERPAWQQIALTDARTGATFTLADFAGKTVFVEPFATWCTNCRQQLGNVRQAREQLGDDVVFITLSVEPNIANEALAKYANDAGFDWTFAAMPPELLRELAAVQGQTISNPPSTPHFIIRADGSFTELVTGIEQVDALVSRIEAARG